MADEKILDRVAKLLAIAEHANTGEHERDVALAQANSLIAKHAIDEAMLRTKQSLGERRAPARRTIKITEGYSEFLPFLRTIFGEIANANRCSAAIAGNGNAEVFGMDEDVRWVEMLYTNIHFEFLRRLSPNWDQSKGYDENVYNFKVAGYKWLDINALAMKNGERDTRIWEERSYGRHPYNGVEGVDYRYEEGVLQLPTNKMTAVLKAAYKRHAAKIGDTNQVTAVSHSNYRTSYANGFVSRLARRIRDWADEAKQQADTIPGAALALVSSEEAVKAAFYGAFPQFSPDAQREAAERERARKAEERRKDQEWLDSLTPKQRHDELEKRQRAERRNAKASAKYWDEQDKKHDSSAAAAGRRAADKININRHAGHADGSKTRGAIG